MAYADLPLELIDPGPNVRTQIHDDEDAELAASIERHGVLQPIRVRRRGDRFRVVAGSRRYNASLIAGVPTIPAVILDGEPGPDEDRVQQLIENVQRKDLDPIELAEALEATLRSEPGLTAADLARRLGKSGPWVSNHRRLLRLDARTRRKVADGSITMAAAKTMVNRSQAERDRLVAVAESGAGSRAVEHESRPKAPEIRRVRLPVVAGWFVELSWNPGDDEGRLDLVSSSGRYDGGVRLVAAHARRTAAALNQLADVLDRQERAVG